MVVDALANVGESTPDVMRTKASLDGTYRLMDNEKVTPESLLEPHLRQSIERTSQYDRILLVQDTTEVDLTKPSRQVEGAVPWKHLIEQIVEVYKIRWHIELYFCTLKSGMGIEKLQYRTLSRYLNAVILLMIVAWRVQMLTHAARAEPETPCSHFFNSDQWHPLWLVSHPDIPLPDSSPSIHEFLFMVAAMGGYIKKKGQGPPGTTPFGVDYGAWKH